MLSRLYSQHLHISNSLGDHMLNSFVDTTRALIAQMGRTLFDRHLTDAAGGNISVRVDDVLCITATLSGQHKHWQLQSEDVLVTDLEGRILDGSGQLSRETRAHLELHRAYGQHGQAIIHAHPRNIMVFAALAKPMQPVIEATRKFGIVPIADYAPSETPDLALHVVEALRGHEKLITKCGAACIAPWHGLFVMAQDLYAAFDAVELLDTNAYCTIMGRQLTGADAQEAAREQMETTINRFYQSQK